MNYSTETLNNIAAMKIKGIPSRAIADALGISKSGVNYAYNRWVESPTLLYDPHEVAFAQTTPEVQPEQIRLPKVLFIDIETAADIAATFRRFKANLGQANIVREGGWLLSAAWQWLGSDSVQSIVLEPNEALQMNDMRILGCLYELLEEADLVVAHNGDSFDLPMIKARMAINNFPAPKKVKTIDTLKIARQMKFQSNKLDSLGEVLNVGRKLEHEGIKLWIDCQQGDAEALERMRAYNVQDVKLLVAVYHQLKHFDVKAPNMALYYNDNKERCPVCGSEHVEPTGNSVYTQVSEFAEMHCKDCGARSRKRKILNSKEKRSNLLM